MNQSEKHKFEEEWERMFESASETPPPAVWDAIEKHLDGEDIPAIVPLVWWKNPKVFYAAAAAVALLLLSWPILRSGGDQAEEVVATVPKTPSATTQPEAENPYRTEPAESQVAAQEALVASKEMPSSTAEKAAQNRTKSTPGSSNPLPTAADPLLTGKLEGTRGGAAEQEIATLSSSRTIATNVAPTELAFTETEQRSGVPEINKGDGIPPATFMPVLNESIALLTPVGVSEVDVHLQRRYVFFKYENIESDITPPTQSKEYWAGLGIMPASFNPGVSVTTPPAAFSMAKASRQSLSNSSKAGLSYAVQMQTGMKLSKHWTLETGLSYLQGNSTFESDGYVLDASTNRSANVLEGALLAGAPANDYAASPSFSQGMNIAAVYIDLDQKTNNDYRFMQVPVQAGYVINPEGKINYTLLGGTVANVFLRNEVDSGSGTSFVNTADDGIYRSLSWSAATGVRMNYRLSDHWSASLTGSYQKSLTSGLRSGSSLESRPQLYGVAWGVRYVF